MRSAAYVMRVGALAVALGIGAAAGGMGAASASDLKSGVVKWFNAGKGFGFIEVEGGPDYFVHYRAVKYGTLVAGQKVTFIGVQGQKGPQADEVTISGDPRDNRSVVTGPAAVVKAATSAGSRASTPTDRKTATLKPGLSRTTNPRVR